VWALREKGREKTGGRGVAAPASLLMSLFTEVQVPKR
jgi:hypothetical protein